MTTPAPEAKKAPRPPEDRGQGRRKLPESERRVGRSLRLKPASWEVFDEVGGTRWLEAALELAKKTLQSQKKESPPS